MRMLDLNALDRKMWREFWAMRMQALAIAMVIVGGVGIFIMSLSTLHSLFETREAYYREHHFADVFANLKRAPISLAGRIEEIPGVDRVQTRVIAYVSLDVEGFDDPISAHLISLPDRSRGVLNQIYLRSGNLLEPGRNNDILVSEEFAEAHSLEQGGHLAATINGRRKILTVGGRALSPEYIYQIAPGAMFPDYERYGVLWMGREPLSTAYDMLGAFNNVTLTLTNDGNEQDVIDRLDDLLAPYGGTGAYARADQLSNRFLSEELKQQETIATVFPIIFFGVAAFLLNVVVSRMIRLQREQVAVLKAFGYTNFAVGVHYIKLILLIVSVGVAGGIAAGIWMGRGLAGIYMDFYSLPDMVYVLKPQVIASAVLVSFAVAVAGTVYAVGKAASLPPAQAMRPEQPVAYRATVLERWGLQSFFSQPVRMILRHIERHPAKSALTTLGIALACGVMVVTGFQEGAIDEMVDVQYSISRREDLTASFTEPTSGRALRSLASIEGVEYVEGYRDVPVRLHFEHRQRQTSLQGIEPDGRLFRLIDEKLRTIKLPSEGIYLADYLAEVLGIEPGEMLTVEILERDRPVLRMPVSGTVRQEMGLGAYMLRPAVNRLMKESDVVSGALLEVDAAAQRNVYRALKASPRIAGVVEQRSAIRAFYDNVAQMILFFNLVATVLGGSIAFGIVYNSMRISLSERERELASLRVLGFREGEVAYILLGEMALLTLAAIPPGFLIGYGLCLYLAESFATELYRIPVVLGPAVYSFAALIVVASAVLSGLMIWRNIRTLDMVAVLKTGD